jgi:hypothetical protein
MSRVRQRWRFIPPLCLPSSLSAWWRDSQSFPASHFSPSSTEGPVFIGTLEARPFRATLQYYMVLSSVTPALSSTTSAFVHKKSKGLFAFLYEDYPPFSLSSLVSVPRRRRLLVTWRSSRQTCSGGPRWHEDQSTAAWTFCSVSLLAVYPVRPRARQFRVFKHLRPSPTEGVRIRWHTRSAFCSALRCSTT